MNISDILTAAKTMLLANGGASPYLGDALDALCARGAISGEERQAAGDAARQHLDILNPFAMEPWHRALAWEVGGEETALFPISERAWGSEYVQLRNDWLDDLVESLRHQGA